MEDNTHLAAKVGSIIVLIAFLAFCVWCLVVPHERVLNARDGRQPAQARREWARSHSAPAGGASAFPTGASGP